MVQILKTRPDGTGFETSSIVQMLFPLGVPCKYAAVNSKNAQIGVQALPRTDVATTNNTRSPWRHLLTAATTSDLCS